MHIYHFFFLNLSQNCINYIVPKTICYPWRTLYIYTLYCILCTLTNITNGFRPKISNIYTRIYIVFWKRRSWDEIQWPWSWFIVTLVNARRESDGRSKRITIELDEVEKTVKFDPCCNKRKKNIMWMQYDLHGLHQTGRLKIIFLVSSLLSQTRPRVGERGKMNVDRVGGNVVEQCAPRLSATAVVWTKAWGVFVQRCDRTWNEEEMVKMAAEERRRVRKKNIFLTAYHN